MWSDWLVFCDCGFQSVCPLMEKDRGLWKFPDGRDWLRGKLSLVLMGGTILSNSLNQFSIDGLSDQHEVALFFFFKLLLLFYFLTMLYSSALTRDQFHAPCIRNVESYPLDHQGSPWSSSTSINPYYYIVLALIKNLDRYQQITQQKGWTNLDSPDSVWKSLLPHSRQWALVWLVCLTSIFFSSFCKNQTKTFTSLKW